MMKRSVAGFVVTLLLMVGVTPCAGWQASAQARHDCCAEGACPDRMHQGGPAE